MYPYQPTFSIHPQMLLFEKSRQTNPAYNKMSEQVFSITTLVADKLYKILIIQGFKHKAFIRDNLAEFGIVASVFQKKLRICLEFNTNIIQ